MPRYIVTQIIGGQATVEWYDTYDEASTEFQAVQEEGVEVYLSFVMCEANGRD